MFVVIELHDIRFDHQPFCFFCRLLVFFPFRLKGSGHDVPACFAEGFDQILSFINSHRFWKAGHRNRCSPTRLGLLNFRCHLVDDLFVDRQRKGLGGSFRPIKHELLNVFRVPTVILVLATDKRTVIRFFDIDTLNSIRIPGEIEQIVETYLGRGS